MLERLFLQVEIGHWTRCWLGGASGFSLGTRGLKKNKLEIEIFLIKKKKKKTYSSSGGTGPCVRL
jgi:hypothetical protein